MKIVKQLKEWAYTLRVAHILNVLRNSHGLNLWDDEYGRNFVIACVVLSGDKDETIIEHILKDFTFSKREEA